MACEIFPAPGSNPCLLRWQVGSLPLSIAFSVMFKWKLLVLIIELYLQHQENYLLWSIQSKLLTHRAQRKGVSVKDRLVRCSPSFQKYSTSLFIAVFVMSHPGYLLLLKQWFPKLGLKMIYYYHISCSRNQELGKSTARWLILPG